MENHIEKCIYNGERYDVPYLEMGRWYAFMKDLSIFTLDAGNCQIEFSDAFSKYRVKQ
jgi:hypothetical protein